MNRKIILFILLLCFITSSSLFAVERTLSTVNIIAEVSIENKMENKMDEPSIDELDMFFETTFVVCDLKVSTILASNIFLRPHEVIHKFFKPPIV